MIKFYTKKDKNPYKEQIYEQWDNNTGSYWRENHVKIWMSRNSPEYVLCLGFFLIATPHNDVLNKVRFKAADPHWVTIDLTSVFPNDKEEFKEYLTQHNITWL